MRRDDAVDVFVDGDDRMTERLLFQFSSLTEALWANGYIHPTPTELGGKLV